MSEGEQVDGGGEPGTAKGGRAQAPEAREEGVIEGIGDRFQLLFLKLKEEKVVESFGVYG